MVRSVPRDASAVTEELEVSMETAVQEPHLSMRGRRLFHDPLIIAIALTFFSLAIYLWQFRFANILSLYDSGVYLAGSINLIHGILPYRDFTFVQPPGILLILSPVAVLAKFIGTSGSFLVGRLLTALVSAIDVGLTAWVLRARGPVAMLIGGLGIALMPVGAYETASIKLEPWTLLFILVAVTVLLRPSSERAGTDDVNLSTKRLFIGGIFFGLAGLIKVFAFLPFLGMLIVLYPLVRKRTGVFIGGAACGFTIPALPFVIAGASQFFQQVIFEQLSRRSPQSMGVGVPVRILNLVGIPNSWLATHSTQVAPFIVILALGIAIILWRMRPLLPIDRFFIAASALTVTGLLSAAQFINYYGYFSLPFLFGLFGITLSVLLAPAHRVVRRIPLSQSIRRFTSGILLLGFSVLIVAITLYTTTYYSNSARVFGFDPGDSAQISALIPPNSCVVYDTVAYGLLSNRWSSPTPNCPHVIDPFGMWLAWGNHVTAVPTSFTSEWKNIFEYATFVVLRKPRSGVIPWNHGLWSWFSSRFHVVLGGSPAYIYQSNAQ
jgi:hypothetical protein